VHPCILAGQLWGRELRCRLDHRQSLFGDGFRHGDIRQDRANDIGRKGNHADIDGEGCLTKSRPADESGVRIMSALYGRNFAAENDILPQFGALSLTMLTGGDLSPLFHPAMGRVPVLNLGLVFPHKDGNGFNLMLQASRAALSAPADDASMKIRRHRPDHWPEHPLRPVAVFHVSAAARRG
jgi:hypothetical protein